MNRTHLYEGQERHKKFHLDIRTQYLHIHRRTCKSPLFSVYIIFYRDYTGMVSSLFFWQQSYSIIRNVRLSLLQIFNFNFVFHAFYIYIFVLKFQLKYFLPFSFSSVNFEKLCYYGRNRLCFTSDTYVIQRLDFHYLDTFVSMAACIPLKKCAFSVTFHIINSIVMFVYEE